MKTALPALLWGMSALPGMAAAEPDTPFSRLPLQHDADPAWSGIGTLQLMSVGIVLVLWLGWLIWRRNGLKQLFAPAQRDGLKVLQSTALTARASLHVVRWDGREWLVGCTERGIATLAERMPPAEAGPVRGEP